MIIIENIPLSGDALIMGFPMLGRHLKFNFIIRQGGERLIDICGGVKRWVVEERDKLGMFRYEEEAKKERAISVGLLSAHHFMWTH